MKNIGITYIFIVIENIQIRKDQQGIYKDNHSYELRNFYFPFLYVVTFDN